MISYCIQQCITMSNQDILLYKNTVVDQIHHQLRFNLSNTEEFANGLRTERHDDITQT